MSEWTNYEAEFSRVFRFVFKDENLVIHPNDSANTIDGWDSITHMKLIDAIESHFDVRFSYQEVRKLQNIQDLVNLVSKHKS